MNITQLAILVILLITLNIIWNSLYSTKNTSSIDNVESHSNSEAKKFSKNSKYFLIAISIIPLIIGFWATNHWFKEYNIAKESVNWQTYPGVILSKEVVFYKAPNTTGSESSGKLYIPEVVYEFTYNNQTVEHEAIDLRNRSASGDISKSEEVLKQLPDVGQPVDVYFSFEHKKAVLIPGNQDSSYFGVIFGIIFMLVGLIAIKFIHSL